MDKKLSIRFDEDKTKALLFTSKRKIKKVPKLNIKTSLKIHPHFDYAS